MEEKDVRRLKCRFTLLNMMIQCQNHAGLLHDNTYQNWIDWLSMRREIQNILRDYDNGMKLNEDFLIKVYDIKITRNIKIVKRLIQLIKIV